MKFELVKDKKGQWFFRLVSANGRIIVKSESYSGKSKATKGIAAVKKCAECEVVEI